MTQADTGPNTKAAGTKPGEHRPGLKAGYVFDEDANAALDGLRRAIKAIAEIASDGDLEGGEVVVNRVNLAALFDLIDDRLGAIVGEDAVSTVWLAPSVFGTRQ